MKTKKEKEVKVGSVVSTRENVTDKTGKPITGYMKVTSLRGGKVNLGSVFGRHIYYKGIPVECVYECEDEWYDKWSKSETYMCM